jgi:PAS domain S-box-containing protein
MKIQYKLFYLFLILILIGGFTTTISTSIILKNGLEQQLIAREKIGQEVLEKRIFPYVANKDYETVTGILFDEKEIKKESIYYIAVYDINGNILTHTFLNEIPEHVKHDVHTGGEDYSIHELSINNIPVIEICMKVKEGVYEVGYLSVGYKKEYIEYIESEIIGAIANIIIILSIISIILGFFLSKGLVKPVKALTRGIEEFGKGNLNYKIKVDSTDEIGQLATSFQKMTEELQRTTISKQTLESIIESMPYGIILIGSDKKILSANHAALSLMGYESEEQIAGMICNKVLCPAEEGKCPIIDFHQKVDRTERVLITKDGRRIPILKSVVSLKLDGRDVLLEAVVDISEQKQAMEELKKLGSAVERSGDSVIITNKNAVIEYVNPAFEKLTGFSREEVIGKTPEYA